MKSIIFGYKRHGKDTACEYLRDRFGLNFSASSWHACKSFLYEEIRDRFGYQSMDECFEDRVNHRQLWYEAIRDYNSPDRSRMGREIFGENDIYCGIRDLEEFESLKRDGLFEVAIWIDASKRKPPEERDSMNVGIEQADIILDNNGSLADLHRGLDALVVRLGWAVPTAREA